VLVFFSFYDVSLFLVKTIESFVFISFVEAGLPSIKCFALRTVEMANCGRLLSAARATKGVAYSSFI
jgi:hypothetical protein